MLNLLITSRPTVPPGIGWATTIEPGHIVSNEPGFYLEGEWGIRIESVVVCKQIDVSASLPRMSFPSSEVACQIPVDKV
jgi:Xaa-Pro aminopeptidase